MLERTYSPDLRLPLRPRRLIFHDKPQQAVSVKALREIEPRTSSLAVAAIGGIFFLAALLRFRRTATQISEARFKAVTAGQR